VRCRRPITVLAEQRAAEGSPVAARASRQAESATRCSANTVIWGAYSATPGGIKYASRSRSRRRPRPSRWAASATGYLFISTRPKNVRQEVSVIHRLSLQVELGCDRRDRPTKFRHVHQNEPRLSRMSPKDTVRRGHAQGCRPHRQGHLRPRDIDPTSSPSKRSPRRSDRGGRAGMQVARFQSPDCDDSDDAGLTRRLSCHAKAANARVRA